MPTTEKTQKIIHAFNTKDETAISGYSIQDLKDAIDDLDWRNKGDQKSIQREIDRREKNEDKKYQSHVRAIGIVVALAIALIVGIIIAQI